MAPQSVTPVGSACEMPIYLSHHVDQLDHFWMGGGAVNLKLKVCTVFLFACVCERASLCVAEFACEGRQGAL